MIAFKSVFSAVLLAGILAAPFAVSADDAAATPKPKPYTLTTCIVSGEKLGGEMGEPFVFIYKNRKIKNDPGREIKFCCKSCLKDFNKDPEGYIKKMEAAEAKASAKK